MNLVPFELEMVEVTELTIGDSVKFSGDFWTAVQVMGAHYDEDGELDAVTLRIRNSKDRSMKTHTFPADREIAKVKKFE